MKPNVSILIPVYNREQLIIPCIESALNQKYNDLEVVVVDNASTDGTWKVCQAIAKKDKRVQVFRNDQNIGPVKNWQRCLEVAKGEYGKVLFSDDLMYPDFLIKALPFFQDKDVGFVFTPAVVGTESNEVDKIAYQFSKKSGKFVCNLFVRESLFGENTPFSPGCAIFRMKDLQKNLQLNIPSPTITDFSQHGAGPDLLLYLLTTNNYSKFGYINEPLVFFRIHKDSISVLDKDRYLIRCYRQAKGWFAEEHLPKKIMREYYARVWLQACKQRKKIIPPSLILKDYSYNKISFGLSDVFRFFLMKLKNKIRGFSSVSAL